MGISRARNSLLSYKTYAFLRAEKSTSFKRTIQFVISMRVLVTGGAGFIGSNLALALQEHYEVAVLDNFQNAKFSNLIGFEGQFYTASIIDVDWESLGKFDYIFHQGAISDTRVQDQELMMKTNVDAFRRLLDYAVKTKTHVIYASSAAVYGNTPSPYKENGPLEPLNVYGFSKVMMDHIAEEYMKKYNGVIKIVGLRYFNVFGPREAHKNTFASMIYQLSQQILAGKRPRVFTAGEQCRDHVYVKDIVHINLLAMKAPHSCIVNAATGNATSFNRIIEILNDVLGTNLSPEYFECQYDFFQAHTQADMTKAKELLGYEPQWSMESGIRDYMQWLGVAKK